LEEKLRFRKPTFDGLLTVEADQDLGEVARGDIILFDRNQTHPELERDGIYLLNLPGIVLRIIARRVGDKMLVVGPEVGRVRSAQRKALVSKTDILARRRVSRRGLLGDGVWKTPESQVRRLNRTRNLRAQSRQVWPLSRQNAHKSIVAPMADNSGFVSERDRFVSVAE